MTLVRYKGKFLTLGGGTLSIPPRTTPTPPAPLITNGFFTDGTTDGWTLPGNLQYTCTDNNFSIRGRQDVFSDLYFYQVGIGGLTIGQNYSMTFEVACNGMKMHSSTGVYEADWTPIKTAALLTGFYQGWTANYVGDPIEPYFTAPAETVNIYVLAELPQTIGVWSTTSFRSFVMEEYSP